MKSNDILQASEDAISREVAGEQVLLHLETGTYYGLNPVGACVWQKLEQGPTTLSALVDAVIDEFDAERDVVEADLLDLASQLVEHNLVVHQEG
jgi:hypothetical protein